MASGSHALKTPAEKELLFLSKSIQEGLLSALLEAHDFGIVAVQMGVGLGRDPQWNEVA